MAAWRIGLAAATLVAGEVAGFATRSLAPAWPLLAFLLVVCVLWAWGAGWRWFVLAIPFLIGVVLAWRTDVARVRVLEGNMGMYGSREWLEVEVEGNVGLRNRRSGDGFMVDFASHAGPLPLKVVMPVRSAAAVPKPGERWRCLGWIARNARDGGAYSRHTLWVLDEGIAIRSAPAPKFGFRSVGDRLERMMDERLSWNPQIAALNKAILLGRRVEIPRDRRKMFADAGTIHVFAISGLHVMVIAVMLRHVLGRLGVQEPVRGLVAVPLVVAYTMLVGARPSAVRAAFMATFLLIAPACGRRPDALASLALTAIWVYGTSPEMVNDIGCTMSFTVVAGIVMWLRSSRWLAQALWRRGALMRFAGEVCVSIAAWVAGAPVVACVFGRFALGGLLANLVVLRFAGWMVPLGIGALAAGFFCGPLSAILDAGAVACTEVMSSVSEWVTHIPHASVAVRPWSAGMCIAWYACCIFVLVVFARLAPRRGIRPGRWW